MNKTGKILLSIVAFALIALGVIFWLDRRDITGREEAGSPSPSVTARSYFQDEIILRGVEDIGQPIEGFDAGLLMRAFPGFTVADFDGVESFEGKYRLSEGKLEMVRTVGAPITSAERTLSDEGYRTLLANVSSRLTMPVRTDADIDALIDALDRAAQAGMENRVETRIGQSAGALGVRIVPEHVLEDSRCPEDVQCIQAGTVRLRARLESGLGTAAQTFILGQPVTTEAEEVTLTEVRPAARAGVTIAPGEYRFIFTIKKRDL